MNVHLPNNKEEVGEIIGYDHLLFSYKAVIIAFWLQSLIASEWKVEIGFLFKMLHHTDSIFCKLLSNDNWS